MNAFYRRAFADVLLGPIFVDVAKVDMSVHLPVMCDFWETVLLRAGRYHRNALRPHLDLNSTVEPDRSAVGCGGSQPPNT
ncbi:MAG: group III truncated hemoglobin [Pseudonocardiaceae bacterium]